MADITCEYHPEEKLRFVCLPCDVLICRDCKLTDHEGHRSVDIAKVGIGLEVKLKDHRGRLEQRLLVLDNVRKEVEEDQTAASKAQQRLEKIIKDRAGLLTSWVRQAEQVALSALKATAIKVDSNLSSTSSDLDSRCKEINEMITAVDEAVSTMGQSHSPRTPPSLEVITALRLERDMRTGRGKGENLERLTEGLPTYSVRPVLRGDLNVLTEPMFESFIGMPLYTQLAKTTPKVAISPLFRCCNVTGACVNAICPMPDGLVWVAHDDTEGGSGDQWVEQYTSEGRRLCKQHVQARGRISVARASESWVYVVGEGVKKVMNGEETRDAVTDRNEGSQGNYQQPKSTSVALSKLTARFSIKTPSCRGFSQGTESQDTAICKVEARSLPSMWIVNETLFTIRAPLPQALDVDSSGQYFAVVLPEPSVKLYRPSRPNPVASYCPSGENFAPADVCFYVLDGGTEVLLIADWFNNAVHVLSFKDTFRFQGYLGAGCPLIVHPTALTSDDDCRLWIGCKGGQLLMCVSDEDSSSTPDSSDAESKIQDSRFKILFQENL